ncbi:MULTISPECIES: hypothetical protein [Actinosynnema]|uniref:hypothetical protein n=1 Tax=Actinosynnema TaxID=40566 RepID=UPI0020A274E6|nr:hypothetical protein [Actinosynnema pretiosum]MCP2096293.1 hypothetical protein [Actinosynnema pretiosum]
MLLPQTLVALGALRLPEGTPWTWVACNALLYSALAFTLSPLVGAGAAAGITLVLYFAVGAAHNLWPGVVNAIPVSPYPGPGTHWSSALALAAVAVATHVRTRGSTAWAQRERAGD